MRSGRVVRLVIMLGVVTLLASCMSVDSKPKLRTLADFESISEQQRATSSFERLTGLDSVRDWPLALWVERGETEPGGQALFLGGVRSLSVAEAAEIAQFAGRRVFLPDLMTIDAATASALCKVNAELFLDGLRSIDDATARVFAAEQRRRLSLRGLGAITPTVASLLAQCDGSLHFGALEGFDAATARALASWKGWGEQVILSIGITSIDVEVATELAACRGWGVALNGLRDLDVESARALGRLDTPQLSLNGLQSVRPEIALVISGWGRKFLNLNGVAHVDSEVRRLVETGCEAVSWRGLVPRQR